MRQYIPTVAKFISLDLGGGGGVNSTLAWGCRTGPPGYIGWRNRFLDSLNVYQFGLWRAGTKTLFVELIRHNEQLYTLHSLLLKYTPLLLSIYMARQNYEIKPDYKTNW
jgi:hypothetical protein